MPSTNIVRDIRKSVDTKILPTAPKKWLPQFNFGLQAYVLADGTDSERTFLTSNMGPMLQIKDGELEFYE